MPDIVEQFINFLQEIEEDSARGVKQLNDYINQDSNLGYAKAAGSAQSELELIAIKARVFRNVYLNQKTLTTIS
jgi:hypothetical protein